MGDGGKWVCGVDQLLQRCASALRDPETPEATTELASMQQDVFCRYSVYTAATASRPTLPSLPSLPSCPFQTLLTYNDGGSPLLWCLMSWQTQNWTQYYANFSAWCAAKAA
jgi:hypothetical protein